MCPIVWSFWADFIQTLQILRTWLFIPGEGYVSCSEDKTGDTSQDGSDIGTTVDDKMTAVIELADLLLNMWKDLKVKYISNHRILSCQ